MHDYESRMVPALSLEKLISGIAQPISIAKLDIQGAELEVLQSSRSLLADGCVRNWIVGTHSAAIHAALVDLLSKDHEILFEEQAPEDQPDGVIIAKRR